jgi:hypothetical protein
VHHCQRSLHLNTDLMMRWFGRRYATSWSRPQRSTQPRSHADLLLSRRSCWFLSSTSGDAAASSAAAAAAAGDVRIHRRYECRCYAGSRPCAAGVFSVASRRATPQAERGSGERAQISVDSEEDARAMAAGLADRCANGAGRLLPSHRRPALCLCFLSSVI